MTTDIFILIFVIVTVAAVLEYLLMLRDRRKYPPPGKLIDIGGLRLHLLHMGDAKNVPSVILEGGSLGFSAKWDMVQREVAGFTSVYAYDRAGYGWSDDPQTTEHRERNDQVIVQELHDLIVKAEIPTPCILVGHDIGGQYVYQFARRYPDLVAGIVLVDSFHPVMWPGRLKIVQDMLTSRLLSFIGLVRLETWLRYMELPMSPAAKGACVALHSHAMLYSGSREIKLLDPNIEIKNILGDKPVVVVTQALGDIPEWRGVQSDFLKFSSNSKLLPASYSDHLVILHEPETVVEGIRLVVDAVRSHKPLENSMW